MNTNSIPGLDVPGLNLLPHSWQGPVLAIAFVAPYLGRGYHALSSGAGLKGVWTGIMFGTNVPKPTAIPNPPVDKPTNPS